MILKFGIKDFLEDREYRNLTSRSIGAYRLTLELFQRFCTEFLERKER